MSITFPGSPTIGQIELVNGRYWEWTGDAWELYTPATAAIATSGSASDLNTGVTPVPRLPLATTIVPGIIRVGAGLTIVGGLLANESYVDYYDNVVNFPLPGNVNLLYIARDTSRQYHWTGTEYVEAGTTPNISSDFATLTKSTPAQIVTSVNDYGLSGSDLYKISSSAAYNITGLGNGTDGKVIILRNIGNFIITLKHEDTSSLASNRIIVPWSNDYQITAKSSVTLYYDGDESRWVII